MTPLKRNNWPNNALKDINKFYGDVGTNQTKVDLPYPCYLAWDKNYTINRFTCHEKVADSIYRIMSRTLDTYGMDEIQRLELDNWGGCLNVRKARGSGWQSRHSWGMAVDWSPERNRLKQPFADSQFSHPDYTDWLDFWEFEGWLVGGRRWGRDAMHFQATK